MIEHDIYSVLFELVPDLKRLDHRMMTARGYMDLHVDVLRREPQRMRIALSHYFKHASGDMIPDPDMEIQIDLEHKTARALTFQDSIVFQSVDEMPQLQGSLNRFLNQWLINIRNQGFGSQGMHRGK